MPDLGHSVGEVLRLPNCGAFLNAVLTMFVAEEFWKALSVNHILLARPA